MLKRSVLPLSLAAAMATMVVPAHAALLGPTPYLAASDGPFASSAFTSFYLEDFEDGSLNTPGLNAAGSGLCIVGSECFATSGLTDSVGNGGDSTQGRSLFANSSITLTFDEAVLGWLPTAAGLVWTDGVNPIRFEAFDQAGISLGVLSGGHADGATRGQTAEDRFYGATHSGGISRLVISNPGGIEIDHIQYGLLGPVTGAVPEPGAWALMIAGFGLAGATLRRRRAIHLA
ncbi:MAG: PEPxxWA-CTERM sorting domain-containing protein [Phenylobacterium sp.]|nr:PEPxxWA-CTERM sorting domain-containing protein [Phenylobacterium sp.]